MYNVIFFFFSSRRRHTRWTGDWSSDVCSSDLAGLAADRRVDHREQRGGELDVRDAAEIRGRHESGDVTHDAAPERDDRAIPPELRGEQLVGQRRPRLPRLVPLASWKLQQLYLHLGVVQLRNELFPVQLRHVRIRDHRVAGGRAAVPQQRRQVGQEPAADDDVVGRVAALDDRNANRHHGISGAPAAWLATRASTNSRSESRLRYGITEDSPPVSCVRYRPATARSARRQTVRARCSAAAFGTPPGRTNCLSGGTWVS